MPVRPSTDLADAIAKTKARLVRLERTKREGDRHAYTEALLAAGKIVEDAGLLYTDPTILVATLRRGKGWREAPDHAHAPETSDSAQGGA